MFKKRQAPRYGVKLEAMVWSHSFRSRGQIGVLSETGCCMKLNQKVPVGEEYHLNFDLPGRVQPVRCGGKVVWQEEQSNVVGVEFTGLNERERSDLAGWLSRHGTAMSKFSSYDN